MEYDGPRTIGAESTPQPASVQRTRLPVLGVPIEFEADAPLVLETVESALGAWRLLDYRPGLVSRRDQVPRIRLRLGPDETHADSPFMARSPERQRLELAGPGIRGEADGTTLTAVCVLAPAVLNDRYRFEEQVLAPLTLFVVTRCDRQPLHAAAITRNGWNVLLVGSSGVGKSTLAYAAFRSGWTILADDAVYLQSNPVARIWTRPARLHLPQDAAERFPELAKLPLVQREHGRVKLPLEPPGAWPAAMRPLERATLCLLERDVGSPAARRIAADDAVDTITRALDPGFDVFRDTFGPVLRTIIDERAFIVSTGEDPVQTVALLDTLEPR